MAQLLSGVSSAARYWPVDEIPESDYVRCGDEVARVLVRHPTQQRIRVERGVEGTTAASHAADAEVSAAYVVGTDGGGEQTVRLLVGTVAFDTAGVKDYPGIVVLEVPAGAQVISAGVIVTAAFTESEAVTNNVYWGFADAADASDWIATKSSEASNIGGVPPDSRIQNFDESLTLVDVPPFLLEEGAQVICHMQANVTGGALEVRVLIAETA